ncbi:MAG: hypothetical protein M1504_02755 [Candidatus Marsarchaeota archaeon]|nr:hypothetical protein [Candidatus Marsarchaeota archaeon]
MNTSIAIVGIIIVIMVVAVAVLLVSTSSNQSKSSITVQNTNKTSGTNSSTSGTPSGSAGGISYKGLSISGYSSTPSTFNLTIPYSGSGLSALNAGACAVAGSNSSVSFDLVAPLGLQSGVAYCQGGEYSTPMSMAMVVVTGYKGTNQTVSAPLSTPYVMNYTINGTYSNWLAVIPVACASATCSLTMPHGCTIIQNTSYQNTSASIGICANQAPGTYQVTVNPSSSSAGVGADVYLYYR